MYVYTGCVWCLREHDDGIECPVLMSHSIGTRDQTQVLLRATVLLNHLSRPQIYFKDGTCSSVSKDGLMLT